MRPVLKRRRPPDHPVDLVALLEQQLGQVRAVLPGDPRDKRDFLSHSSLTLLAPAGCVGSSSAAAQTLNRGR